MRSILDIISSWKIALIISALLLCFQASIYAADITSNGMPIPSLILIIMLFIGEYPLTLLMHITVGILTKA